LSQYFDGLTDKQRECVSLRFEYGLTVADIARRLNLHRKTVTEHLQAADSRMKQSGAKNKRAGALARRKPGGFEEH